VQGGYKLQTLSAFLKTPAPPAAPEIKWSKIDNKLAESDPFAFLNFLLQFCPPVGPADVEKPLRAKFAKIGIEAGAMPDTRKIRPAARCRFSRDKKVAPGRGGVGDGRLKDDVPAPNNEIVHFSRRSRSGFPAVSFKATPVKLKRSRSQVKGAKRTVSGPALVLHWLVCFPRTGKHRRRQIPMSLTQNGRRPP
jgi:hypothetical protein